jgi:hypothetical protein
MFYDASFGGLKFELGGLEVDLRVFDFLFVELEGFVQ